jgi:hypothetical protein
MNKLIAFCVNKFLCSLMTCFILYVKKMIISNLGEFVFFMPPLNASVEKLFS